MPGLFKGSEIVQIAIQIEKNGEAYYTTLVKSLKDEKVKDLFQFLADEEKKHISVFENMLESVGRYQPRGESYPGEYEDYMKALAGSHVFTEEAAGEEAAQKVKTEVEAIDMALGFEKDSILFYTEMKKFVPESGHKILDSVIEEEREHLRKLSDIKASL